MKNRKKRISPIEIDKRVKERKLEIERKHGWFPGL